HVLPYLPFMLVTRCCNNRELRQCNYLDIRNPMPIHVNDCRPRLNLLCWHCGQVARLKGIRDVPNTEQFFEASYHANFHLAAAGQTLCRGKYAFRCFRIERLGERVANEDWCEPNTRRGNFEKITSG